MVKAKKRHLLIVLVVVTAIIFGALVGVGGVYLYKHRTQQAKKTTETAKIEPAAKSISLSESQQLQKEALAAGLAGEKSKGLALADKAIAAAKTNDDKARAYVAKASVCYQAKDYACAGPNYASASDLMPKSVEYAMSAAQAYEQARNKPGAIKYYQRAAPLLSTTAPQPGDDSPQQVINAKIAELQK